MSEITKVTKTIDEWMEGKDRGNGLKLTHPRWSNDSWFEPIFKVKGALCWQGLREDNYFTSFGADKNTWSLWQAPKKIKMITMYRAILRGKDPKGDGYIYWTAFEWTSNKTFNTQPVFCDVIAWQEMQVEVEE